MGPKDSFEQGGQPILHFGLPKMIGTQNFLDPKIIFNPKMIFSQKKFTPKIV